ncbi:unnamed protein product [Darwinula stevensoni]|uniref:Peptidase S1 domain-containing protein n=1 Tax=Darwinula stevensoni TaxID=69355 RepID=A0A7R8X5R2_9CRUS|nr:unnamed protein product [Darwinula stevensoni]CAG0885057.1 unnamed protein product [Darwinula stevensoni]
MYPSFTFLFLILLSLSSKASEQVCPNQDILPCTCRRFPSEVKCSRATTGQQISSAFRNGYGISIQLWKFELKDNTMVKELPYGVFGNVSFEKIWIEDTAVQRINETAILPSKDRLKWMSISDSRLEDFPFQILDEFSQLKKLSLNNNSLTSVPAVRKFELKDNTMVKELPYGVFGNVSFEKIWIEDTAVQRINETAILPSKDRLKWMSISDSRLEDFPFQILDEFSQLKKLSLNNNSLTSVPAVRCASLEDFSFYNNNISKVDEDGWETPNLKYLFMSHNPLAKFPSAMIRNLKKLEMFECSSCRLGPTLSSGLLEFRSGALKVVSLFGNNISRIDPEAMRGLQFHTKIYLSQNNISELNEEFFRPILDVIAKGTGSLYLYGNPIQCGCFLAWLALAPHLRRHVKGSCEEGTLLKAQEARKMCNLCPHKCVSNLKISLCKNETVNLTKFDGCTNDELCCQLEDPIIGLQFHTKIYLSQNNISELNEEFFRPILDVIAKGTGSLYLYGNPIQCGCFLAWLALAPHLRRHVKGSCEEGTLLKAQEARKMCNLCPHKQSNIEMLSVQVSDGSIHHNISTYFIHANFSQETLDNDLMILSLEGPVIVDDGACILCLQSHDIHSLSQCELISHNRDNASDIGKPVTYQASITNSSICEERFTKGSSLPLNSICVSFSSPWCGKPGAPLFCKDSGIGSPLVTCPSLMTNVKRGKFPGSSQSNIEMLSVQVIDGSIHHNISTYFIHANFSQETLDNDFMILSLEGPVKVDDGACILCLQSHDIHSLSQCELISHNGDNASDIGKPVTYQASITNSSICEERFTKGSSLPLNSICVSFSSPWCGKPGDPLFCKDSGTGFPLRVLPEGGKPLDNRNYIWPATIYDMEKKHIICGGALIQKQWVLTAAHCAVVDGSPRTRKEWELLVYLGKYHQNNSMDDEFVQIRQVSKIVVHEDFNFQNYDSDIALLKLTEPAVLTLRVQLVCLPSETNIEVENRGKVASWGSNILEKRSAVLMEMELPIISNANCRQNTINMTGDHTLTHSLTSNMFCAGHDNATPLEESLRRKTYPETSSPRTQRPKRAAGRHDRAQTAARFRTRPVSRVRKARLHEFRVGWSRDSNKADRVGFEKASREGLRWKNKR